MKTAKYFPALFLAMALPLAANAAGSMLRITCEGDDVGAEVLLNGQFKGECPMDLTVPAGISKLKVTQKKKNKEDYIFEQDIRVGDGVVKKIDAHLVSKLFLQSLEKAETGDIQAIKKVALAYSEFGSVWARIPASKEKEITWTRKAAEAGDSSSMFALGVAYKDGDGIEKNADLSDQWFRRALTLSLTEAEKGSSGAMDNLGSAYLLGRGVSIDREKAAAWFHKAKDKGSPIASEVLRIHGLQ